MCIRGRRWNFRKLKIENEELNENVRDSGLECERSEQNKECRRKPVQMSATANQNTNEESKILAIWNEKQKND